MLISEAFERYREDVIVFTNQSPKTEESHNSSLHSLVRFLGDIDIGSLTFEHVRLWKADMSKTLSDITVRGYIIKLRVVLTYLRRIGIDALDPELIPVPKRSESVPKFISPEEVTQLIDASFRIRGKAIISLLYASGIRVSELCSLDRGMIQNGCFTIVGKGKKPRLCFIDTRTKQLLEKYLATRKDNHPALFISTQGLCRMTPTNIQFVLQAACRNAHIDKHVTPHVLRHSFATNLLRNNTNMRYVQEMMGHASLQTTQMYTHVVNMDLQKVYAEKHSI